MIQLNSISKVYGKDSNSVQALIDININIEKGDMLAIIGPSGSGKSTLLNILGLLDEKSSGTYLLNSIDIDKLTEKEKARYRNQLVGFVVQDFALVEDYTVMQNIELPLIYSTKKYSKKDIKIKVQEVLDKVGLNEKINTLSNNLSGGQRQRVSIARALINNPEIILADEPTGSLDSTTSKEIMKLFTELNKNGKTIILITHDRNIANYCNKIIEIKDGSII